MQQIFKDVFELSRGETNTLPVLARNSKLMEETGEFSQALLYKLGYLPHKNIEEPLIGETADVILCLLDTLSSAYPENTPEELQEMLLEQLEKKSKKWEKVMKIRADIVSVKKHNTTTNIE